uniref:BICD family-like cargo adapter 2 n=1 Tax=Varanus komodoensis TaxID=61221 RepID=A0A8D2J532_VARKO
KRERGGTGAALRTPFPLTPPPALGDELYPFAGERPPSLAGDAAAGERDPEEDLEVQLQRKEQDLLLAAELGKMLLERNEELERRCEELTKEHLETKEVRRAAQRAWGSGHLRASASRARSCVDTQQQLFQRLLLLHQEKHELRLHLESRQGEFETRVAELEADLKAVQAQLGQQRLEQQDTSRESSQAVLDLSEQNQRLVEQLSQVSQLEQQLREDLTVLRGEHRTLTLSSTEHAARAQSLHAENHMLQQRNQDLEKQTWQLREENESVQALVDTLHDNLLLLQKESHEKELREKAKSFKIEAEELRTSNRRLQHQVKEMKEEIRLHDLNTSVNSIQSEIESSLEDAPGAPGKAPKCMTDVTLRAHTCITYLLPCALFFTRKSEIELEMAKVSLERDSLSQQLLRVIRQKMALSQELEAWQVSKMPSEMLGLNPDPLHSWRHQLPGVSSSTLTCSLHWIAPRPRTGFIDKDGL